MRDSPSRAEIAVKMYDDGASFQEIASKLSWKESTARAAVVYGRNYDRYLEMARLRYRTKPEHAETQAKLKSRSERNRRIVSMVLGGATYSEAATAQGVTRNVVAGVCNRAGVTAPMSDAKASRARARKSAAAIKRWKKQNEMDGTR